MTSTAAQAASSCPDVFWSLVQPSFASRLFLSRISAKSFRIVFWDNRIASVVHRWCALVAGSEKSSAQGLSAWSSAAGWAASTLGIHHILQTWRSSFKHQLPPVQVGIVQNTCRLSLVDSSKHRHDLNWKRVYQNHWEILIYRSALRQPLWMT